MHVRAFTRYGRRLLVRCASITQRHYTNLHLSLPDAGLLLAFLPAHPRDLTAASSVAHPCLPKDVSASPKLPLQGGKPVGPHGFVHQRFTSSGAGAGTGFRVMGTTLPPNAQRSRGNAPVECADTAFGYFVGAVPRGRDAGCYRAPSNSCLVKYSHRSAPNSDLAI